MVIYENIELRLLKDDQADYKKLEEWYQQKEIYTHFEQRILSYDEIEKKYQPRTKESAQVPVYMIEYDNKPIGIVQYQLINDENKKLYQLNTENNYEIDIFIGELNYHNKGIGAICIDLISKYLFQNKNANLLVMCPLKNNYNAIKCYQKSGFKIINEFTTSNTIGINEEYVLMVKER